MAENGFFFMLLPALLPIAFFFCQATAATGNLRGARPALWGGLAGLALAGGVWLVGVERYSRAETLSLLLLVCVPLCVFAASLARAVLIKVPTRQVTSGVRWALGVLPLLFALAMDSDVVGVLLTVLLTEAAALSLFCTVMGSVPVLTPFFAAVLTALNVATALYLFREFFRMSLPFFFFVVFAPAVVPAWQQYRALPPGGRLCGRLPGDARWALGMFVIVFLTLFLPWRMRGSAILLLPVLVMTVLACAVMGNTRAVRPGVFAGGVVLLCLWWFSTLGPIAGAVGWIMLVVLLVAPAVVFALGLFAMVSEKAKTLAIPPLVRILLGIAGATGLAGFAAVLLR